MVSRILEHSFSAALGTLRGLVYHPMRYLEGLMNHLHKYPFCDFIMSFHIENRFVITTLNHVAQEYGRALAMLTFAALLLFRAAILIKDSLLCAILMTASLSAFIGLLVSSPVLGFIEGATMGAPFKSWTREGLEKMLSAVLELSPEVAPRHHRYQQVQVPIKIQEQPSRARSQASALPRYDFPRLRRYAPLEIDPYKNAAPYTELAHFKREQAPQGELKQATLPYSPPRPKAC